MNLNPFFCYFVEKENALFIFWQSFDINIVIVANIQIVKKKFMTVLSMEHIIQHMCKGILN